ncbi:Tail Collar domain protein [Dickeya parazeae Ech586]|uniref:Tail Collar domain protein n=1 Tax=Dickeya zeae (strain Ech586) TaxID=590409 RepID=D2BT14_DICZ5|nr:phage tail protein [Dickeya parazeae]ACZ75651.1 Tail Collar domain protein [Dickeya parazeae Ech586]
MAQSVITHAFETWNVQRVLDGVAARPDKVVFALVPGQDESVPVDRNEGSPPAEQIQHTAAITQAGVLNENAVVYSVVLDTTVGDWDYNWIGLLDSQTNTVLMIVHVRTQQKLATRNGQQGNSLTRNLMMQFDGAAAATQINVTADTWQIDFSARLNGMDEELRLSHIDVYGRAAFINDAFLVVKSNGQYQASSGVGYLGGLRVALEQPFDIVVDKLPTTIVLDVCRKGEVTGRWETVFSLSQGNGFGGVVEYLDDVGIRHYRKSIANIDSAGWVHDLRIKGTLSQQKAIVDFLRKDNNLAALSDKEASRKNLGLGALATMDVDTARQALHIDQIDNDRVVRAGGGNGMADGHQISLGWTGSGLRVQVDATSFDLWHKDNVFPIHAAEIVGIPLPYPGATAPDGWLKCNGQSFNKAAFPLLAQRYPSGFLPDLRGEFIRGWDDSRGVDPGRGLLSFQESQNLTHSHGVNDPGHSHPYNKYEGSVGSGLAGFDYDQDAWNATVYTGHVGTGISIAASGGHEARPRNIAFNYIVRAA